MRSPVANMTRSPGTSVEAMTLCDAASRISSAEMDGSTGDGDSAGVAPSSDANGQLFCWARGPALLRGWLRTRWAWSGTRWFSASIDFSDRYSCTKPTVTTMVTATVMLTASSVFPTSIEARAEASRRRISGSLNWRMKRSHRGSGGSWGISFGPSRSRERPLGHGQAVGQGRLQPSCSLGRCQEGVLVRHAPRLGRRRSREAGRPGALVVWVARNGRAGRRGQGWHGGSEGEARPLAVSERRSMATEQGERGRVSSAQASRGLAARDVSQAPDALRGTARSPSASHDRDDGLGWVELRRC